MKAEPGGQDGGRNEELKDEEEETHEDDGNEGLKDKTKEARVIQEEEDHGQWKQSWPRCTLP